MVDGDMLRIFMSSVMRWRSGEICLDMAVLLSAGLHERAILTGAANHGEGSKPTHRTIMGRESKVVRPIRNGSVEPYSPIC